MSIKGNLFFPNFFLPLQERNEDLNFSFTKPHVPRMRKCAKFHIYSIFLWVLYINIQATIDKIHVSLYRVSEKSGIKFLFLKSVNRNVQTQELVLVFTHSTWKHLQEAPIRYLSCFYSVFLRAFERATHEIRLNFTKKIR